MNDEPEGVVNLADALHDTSEDDLMSETIYTISSRDSTWCHQLRQQAAPACNPATRG
jgi:hypothetical protein